MTINPAPLTRETNKSKLKKNDKQMTTNTVASGLCDPLVVTKYKQIITLQYIALLHIVKAKQPKKKTK